MNDLAFANYENYYCAPSHQVTDILTQSVEYEEMLPNIQYINNGSCDMVFSSQVTTPADQCHQQSGLFTFITHTREDQERLENTCASKRVTSANGSAPTGTSPAAFGSIPFVQIHTTDVQPQRTSYGNVFRRNVSRQEEIKSEPIKSENSDNSKERINTTPTPPRAATNASQNSNNLESKEEMGSTDKKRTGTITSNIEDKSMPLLQIYKCSKCAFISLKETEREDHLAAQHGESNANTVMERSVINCPGCINTFYAEESLQIHLQLDHLMNEDDARKLTVSLLSSNKQEQLIQAKTNQDQNLPIQSDEVPKEPLRKSRIYLKNVDCLREPNRQPIEQTDNQLEENTLGQTLATKKPNAPKQKISIKSVDVLREPALLRRDYELQNSNVNNFLNFNTDLLNSNMELLNTPINLNTNNTAYDYNQHLDNVLNNTNNVTNNHNECSIPSANSSTKNPESNDKPRKPKIYVKSVESFNLMPLDTLHSSNNKGFSNDHNNLCNNSQVYDSNVVHLPYIFDSNTTSNSLNNNVSFLNNHNDMDTFQFINASSNQSNNFMLENTLFLGNNEELNENGEQMENANLINDGTTPKPPSTADISLNMNKHNAQTSQEQRGTLHLRTVDELNLMNKTEVQHLIAPNLDNNHSSVEIVDKGNSSSLNDINLIGDELYGDDNFKFHDLDTQMVNDWPETYEDLANDINCIIADASNENSAEHVSYPTLENNQKIISNNSFDIDTPQVSLITIRDIEELTGVNTAQAVIINSNEYPTNVIVEHIQNSHTELATQINIVSQETLMPLDAANDSDNSRSNLKRELVNATPESNDTTSTTTTTKALEQNYQNENDPKTVTLAEMPPLVPVTSTMAVESSEKNLSNTKKNNVSNTDLPVPPLVPVSPLVKLSGNLTQSPPAKPASPVEKGRIYVANNLMEPTKAPVAVFATSGTSVRGRPFGANRTRITKLKQTIGSSAEDLFVKCAVKGCAFRFKKTETVEYHRKCHDMTSDNPQAMLCPECNSKEYNNWNTLHTHLWRAHKIDLELYKCELCDFKTPIFSRLVNTHAKIHFDDRNYKCEQCEKAFKNSKQLKNHRRWHRVQAATATASTTVATPVTSLTTTKANKTEIHRCPDCGSTFSQQKTLREHCCKNGGSSLKCSICEKLMSSKSSLKLHLLTHSDGEKRYKCQNCDYATNDHNAFRRHRMGHENRKMYNCSFCPYKSVQSVAYQKHILQKHPEQADSVIHKCSACSFSTINRSLLIVHQAKHDNSISSESSTTKTSENNSATVKNSENLLASSATELQTSKIKVKRNLFTTNMETDMNINKNIVNVVQLYTVDSGSVT